MKYKVKAEYVGQVSPVYGELYEDLIIESEGPVPDFFEVVKVAKKIAVEKITEKEN